MTACPPDDVLGALVRRTLDERAAAEVTSHLDECASCREIVVAAVRGGLAAGTPTEPASEPGARAAPIDREIGARIGRYEIRALLGAGGMGRVYEAFDPELDRSVALKLVRPELGLTSLFAERLVRESRLAAKVVHPAVITVHDAGRYGDAVFIAMDLVRGETLGAYVARARPGWRAILALFERAGQGLAAAHAAGIVHRDFKPDNVLVEGDGARIVVTDFGVASARTALARSAHSRTGSAEPDEARGSAPGSAEPGSTPGSAPSRSGIAGSDSAPESLHSRTGSAEPDSTPGSAPSRSGSADPDSTPGSAPSRSGSADPDSTPGSAPSRSGSAGPDSAPEPAHSRSGSAGSDSAPGSVSAASPAASSLTAPGIAVGTPAYMAPEQLDAGAIDHRADVFAFAGSAWEALFGARPFAGRTIAEIRAAMAQPPRPPRGHRVPARVVRALERGLAIDPAARWQDMTSFVRELAAARAPRRTAALVAAGAALVGLGIGGARLLDSDEVVDPCAAGLARFEAAYTVPRIGLLGIALAGEPRRAKVFDTLAIARRAWRDTQLATCHADREPVQPTRTATCLEARRLEVAGFVEDVLADGPLGAAHASRMSGIIGDPAACHDPAPGLLAARVPADLPTRRVVTQLRYQLFDGERARDRGDTTRAIQVASRAIAAAPAAWPPLRAEALYLLGTSQMMGGEPQAGLDTMREGAAFAERVHHDYIAGNLWLQLAFTSLFDFGDPRRAMEYLTYAESAIDRVGRPPAMQTMLDYHRGLASIESGDARAGEPLLRRAFESAERHAPELVPQVIQGLGYFYEDQARFTEAVEAYRRALAGFTARPASSPATEVVLLQRLASCLATLGQVDEAVDAARRAYAIAERTMDESNPERAVARAQLADVLSRSEHREEALAEARAANAKLRELLGERHERYGEALVIEAKILRELGHEAESVARYARACEIIAFGAGEGTPQLARCWIGEMDALLGVERFAEGLALADKALLVLREIYGDDHPETATVYAMRGYFRSLAGRPGGIADLERAIAVFERHPIDTGHLGGAQWGLGRALWREEPARARALVEQAVASFETATGSWEQARRDAQAWLASHPKRR